MIFQLKDISKYRSQIMGVAMIWVVLYHYQIDGVLDHLTSNGFTGVDLFMLCSGLGLFYSYDKRPETITFYKKRIIRIFPTYYAIGLLAELFRGDFSFPNYLWKYTTLGFWTDGTYDNWFIPGIILIYILYPFIHGTIYKDNKIDRRVIAFVYMVLLFFVIYTAFWDKSIMDTNHFLLLYRIPMFLLGTIVAYWIKTGKNSRKFVFLSLFMLPLLGIHFLRELYEVSEIHMKYLSTTFSAPLIIILLCMLFNNVPKYNFPILRGVGNASLEIFLLHTLTATVFNRYEVAIVNHNTTMFLACLVTVICGVLLHKFIEGITHRVAQI